MQFKFLDENTFYNTFLFEISDVQCGDHYDENNPQHVDWLKRFVSNLFLCGGKALCLYSDDDNPIGFIYLLYDKGLEKVACFGKKATICMFEVKEQFRSKGYGKLLCQEAEKYLRDCGAECLYTDTPDDPDDRRALTFYIRNGFSPVGFHPCVNGKDDVAQIYLFKYL
ncbi:MAG: GNAT family N-acetyltransferase [Oscillospiraceae bacterium]|nr:GNAT family N-acetyltransferase [Oscillospiraceae bacterium]